jgi:hypothetical protein
MNINLGISLAGLNDVFIHKQTTPSAAVTGTLTETQVYALTIPANSFSAGDNLSISNILASKIGSAGNATIYIKLSTSSTMPAGTTDRVGTFLMAATNLHAMGSRRFIIDSGNIKGITAGINQANGDILSNGVMQSISFDPTVTNYLYISVILGNTGDSVTVHGYTLKNF